MTIFHNVEVAVSGATSPALIPVPGRCGAGSAVARFRAGQPWFRAHRQSAAEGLDAGRAADRARHRARTRFGGDDDVFGANSKRRVFAWERGFSGRIRAQTGVGRVGIGVKYLRAICDCKRRRGAMKINNSLDLALRPEDYN